MEASQTRDYCVAALLNRSCATLRAARLGPSATIEPSLQDDKHVCVACALSMEEVELRSSGQPRAAVPTLRAIAWGDMGIGGDCA
jgi:hypothetical protein